MSDYFWQPLRMECMDDGKVRTVRIKCHCFDGSPAADTFFSVPANCRVRGKYIHGYVTTSENEFYFRAHDVCKDRFK